MATGRLRVLQKLNNYEQGVEIRLMRNGPNRNKWNYQNLDKYYQTFLGRPILIAYVNGSIGMGHEMKERVDASGQAYYSFTDGTSERIIGTLSEDPKDIWMEKDGEYTWIVAKGKLYTFYAKEAVDAIIESGTYEISVETEVIDSYMEDGVEVFTNWKALGVTILGAGVAPAIPGANIKALRALESQFKELKLRAAQLIKASTDEDGSTDDDVTDEPDEEDKDSEGIVDVDDPKEPEEENEPESTHPADDDINKNPQKQKLSKGETTLNIFHKRQVAELAVSLADKFNGYSLLSAGEDEHGIHLCLMSDDGSTAVYSMESLDDVIDERKIRKTNACASFKFGEDQIDVEVADFTDRLATKLLCATSDLESTTAELKAAQETVETMKSAEKKRRVSAAKAKAAATLAMFNANRDEKVDASALDCINEAIDNGEYTDCLNGEGEWCGEEAVCNAVLAKCAEAVIEFDKAQVARNSSHYIWTEASGKARSGEQGVDALLAQWREKRI